MDFLLIDDLIDILIIGIIIHLSNVLTDHFSNPLSEKTTNDIPMIFLLCHFKTTFYRLPVPKPGIYLKIIQKAIFMFYHTCIACINTITFKIGYFTRYLNLLTRKAQNTVEFETRLCSTFQMRIADGKAFFLRYRMIQNNFRVCSMRQTFTIKFLLTSSRPTITSFQCTRNH